jgi:hypothetical protein
VRNPARERSRNLNREVWESPSVYGGEDVKDVGFYLTHGDNATILTESQQGIDKIRLGFTIVQPCLHFLRCAFSEWRAAMQCRRHPTESNQGTCALIMYLLGERSSPLHCGQNPLL